LNFPLSAGTTTEYAYRESLSCEGYRDGAEKAKIRWQAQEEIQDGDPKDGSTWGKKKKIPQACANFG